jgi:hypothetical protein
MASAMLPASVRRAEPRQVLLPYSSERITMKPVSPKLNCRKNNTGLLEQIEAGEPRVWCAAMRESLTGLLGRVSPLRDDALQTKQDSCTSVVGS